jgi:histone H3/H4
VETITKRHKEGAKTYPIYHKTEVEDGDVKIDYKHWKDSSVVKGDWAITDDDYIVEVIDRKTIKKKDGSVAYQIVLPIGRAWTGKSTRFEYLARKSSGNFNSTTADSYEVLEARSSRGKKTIKVYANMLLTGKVDWSMLGQVYRPDQQIPEATVKRFLKSDKARLAVNDAIKDILQSKGINESFAIDLIVRAAQIAEKRESAGELLKCSQEIQRLLGMSPKSQYRESQEITGSAKLFGLLDSESLEHEKVKLKREVEYGEE